MHNIKIIQKFGNSFDYYTKKIKIAEISQLVLRGLNANGTEQEKIDFIQFLENGLARCRISPNMISLGKNAAGTKSITLADILPKDMIK